MVMRDTLVFLSRRRRIGSLMTALPLTRRLAARFVAGERLDEAVAAVRALNARRIRASLDYLGESVETPDEAERAASTYVEILDRIAEEGLDSNVSLKLTQMGIDLGYALCRENLARVLDRASERGNFVRVDMEDSAHTQVTLDLVSELRREFENVGVVIQAYLYRSEGDIAALIESGTRVRLCKGAYAEPPDVAFPAKADTDRAFAKLMERLLERGNYPAIATHDESLIRHAVEFARDRGIARSRFEFQMLYGIRRDLQDELAGDGYNVRVYVPFGTEWYSYTMRRLAERPENVAFVLTNLFRR